MMHAEHDLHTVVRLKAARPDILSPIGLPIGAQGCVVHVFAGPDPAYEVEFCDENGRTLALLTLKAHDIESAVPRTAVSA